MIKSVTKYTIFLTKNVEIGKLKQQYYVNRHCKTRTVEIGDKVLVLQKKAEQA